MFQSRRAGFLFFYLCGCSHLAAVARQHRVSPVERELQVGQTQRRKVSIPSSGIFVFLLDATKLCYSNEAHASFNPVERDFCFSTATCGGERPN